MIIRYWNLLQTKKGKIIKKIIGLEDWNILNVFWRSKSIVWTLSYGNLELLSLLNIAFNDKMYNLEENMKA